MILLIDSYDSFSNNLARLFEKSTGKEVVVVHNDFIEETEYEAFLKEYLDFIDYIVIGPGPGLPSNPKDVGIIGWLFKYFDDHPEIVIPIFGICLGFQCLCFQYGNEVEKLKDVKHGQIYDVVSLIENEPLFNGQFEKSLPSVRYHSLYVDMNKLNSEIIPLAICTETSDMGEPTDILMSAKHRKFPFYGVQYHPESICTEYGDTLVRNFDSIAKEYNYSNRSHIFSVESKPLHNAIKKLRFQVKESPLFEDSYIDHIDDCFVSIEELDFDAESVTPVAICDLLFRESHATDFILLNSASIPGEWSIIGLPERGYSEVLTHSVDEPNIVKILNFGLDNSQSVNLLDPDTIWTFVAERFADNYISRGGILSKIRDSVSHGRPFPFLGGYLGLFSYEEGRHVNTKILGPICDQSTTDMKLVFIERFILLDHLTHKWFIMSVNRRKDDSNWCKERKEKLHNFYKKGEFLKQHTVNDIKELLSKQEEIKYDFPSEEVYKKQFQLCQDFLHAGDSYELCLTTALKIFLPSSIQAWEVYKILAEKNPSPFSCFMDFKDCTLISSSPERFLSWKGQDETKTVELRPIKGTVKNTPEVDLEAATKILKTPKEMGENLMIVDLIRHDLHQFIDDIEVPQLMSVEEYKSVFQLVSVVRGEFNSKKYHGIDILCASLPPGSMTGAPKKRSIEILQQLESMQPNSVSGGRRGIYSGVVGYWSVTDDSDWSVIIRSVYHYQADKDNTTSHKVWRIGAGGAITVLSDPEGEWDEMKIKLTSALQALT